MYIFGGTNGFDEAQSDFYELNLINETCHEISIDG